MTNRQPRHDRHATATDATETLCSGCGSCCDPVVLSMTPLQVAASNVDERTKRWVAEELTPMKHREVRAVEPWLLDTPNLTMTLHGEATLPYFYRCRWFDRDTRTCTNYDDRPPGCRDYPWGATGGVPDPRAALPPSCSFRADIGLPVYLRSRAASEPSDSSHDR